MNSIKEELESVGNASIEEMLGGTKRVESFNDLLIRIYQQALKEAYYHGWERGCDFAIESLKK